MFPRPRPGVVVLVILGNEIARVGRDLGYCWLVDLVGWLVWLVDAIGEFLVMLVSTCA